jgi:hypothetical protein
LTHSSSRGGELPRGPPADDVVSGISEITGFPLQTRSTSTFRDSPLQS